RINSCRASIASSGFMRLRTFSQRSGSMAAKSRTSLSRVLHFAYLLQPMPIARRTEMIQKVISVLVTREIKKQNVLATTQQLLSDQLPRVFHSRHVLRNGRSRNR